jgi:ParB-like chromosome segregation protein Spo0J
MSDVKTPKPVKKPIDWLKPYELNSKKHDEAQVKKIAESIKKFGWITAIVTDADGVIIAGHGRRLAALSLGLTEVPVIVRDDLTPDEVRAARLADNRVAMGDIDTDLLKKELESLDFDLEGIFDKKELEFFSVDLGELNADALVANVEQEAVRMASETAAHVEEADKRPVKIDKALGFKTINGAAERVIARFMALIESQTGLTGASAFEAHAKQFIGAAA